MRRKQTIIAIILVTIFAGFFVVKNFIIKDEEIIIGCVDWPENIIASNIAKILLEEKGYSVKIEMMDVNTVFEKLSIGECDVFLGCWLPITHESYIYKYGTRIENIGYNYEGAQTGLLVPSYVSIDSIKQLNQYRANFSGKIYGIQQDAGICINARRAIEAYELNYEMVYSNNDYLISRLEKAIDNKEWIVITGWSPHWILEGYDLKFLFDPKYIYGAGENIQTIARKNFSNEYPKVVELLYKLRITEEQINTLLYEYKKEDDEEIINKTLQKWINENKYLNVPKIKDL